MEELAPLLTRGGARVLDVGSGSGFLAAALANLVGEGGVVHGVDHVPELVRASEDAVRADQPELLSSGRLHLHVADGRDGLPEGGPFDAIHVGAAAPTVPLALKQQLRVGGSLVLPVGAEHETQQMLRVDRVSDTEWRETVLMSVRYIPLTDKDRQLRP